MVLGIRAARGVRGIRLDQDARVISLILPQPGGLILTASENGYGKQSVNDYFPVRGRGGKGNQTTLALASSRGAPSGSARGRDQQHPGSSRLYHSKSLVFR